MSIQKRAKILPWIAAIAVAVLVGILAVPSLAAPGGAKNYSFTFTPATVNAGTNGQAFSVTVTNRSPGTSSSNFSSMTIKVPSQFKTITNVAVAPPSGTTPNTGSSNPNSGATTGVGTANPSCRATGATAQTISVCNLDPTKSLEFVKVTFNANVPNSDSLPCGPSDSDPWAPMPFTGSSLTGTGFTEKPVNDLTPTTTIQKTCFANIAGKVWHDRNFNGTQEISDGESGLGNWFVGAFTSNGTFVKSDQTADDGTYTIESVPSGVAYKVCEFAPPEDSGFEYRGWVQKLPSGTSCTGLSGDQPGDYTVQPTGIGITSLDAAGATGIDFYNTRTVTVACTAPGDQIFTVGGNGDPESSVTITAANCKPGEFVFESWIKSDGTQETDFYPTVSGGASHQITQTVAWALTTKVQSLLQYDDLRGHGFRDVKFCEKDAQGNYSMPASPVDTTTCLVSTSENATQAGVGRSDTIITLVDGKLRQTTP